jgi:hypothetical protein
VDVPDESRDSPSDQADLALAEIERLQRIEKELRHAILVFTDTADRDGFTAGRDRFTADRDRFTAGRDRFTAARDRFTAARDRFTAARDRFTAARDRFIDRVHVIADDNKRKG